MQASRKTSQQPRPSRAKISRINVQINPRGLAAVVWRGRQSTRYPNLSVASLLRIKQLAGAGHRHGGIN